MRRNLWISLAVAALVCTGLGALFLAGGTALAGLPDPGSGPALASLPGGASPTPTLCPTGNYGIAQSPEVAIVPGTTDIGNNCDDCVTNVALPFAYTLYDQTFSSVNVSSNGNLQFSSSNDAWGNNCLP